MKKIMAAALLGTVFFAAQPALAGTFLVEVGAPLGSPNGGGNNDEPKIRVVNTTPGSATTPYLLSFVLQLDTTTAYTIGAISDFGGGSFPPGSDNSPGVGASPTVVSSSKSASFTYGATNFDPGAYSVFTLNFGPGTTDFRDALFLGTNTVTALFSDGSTGVVTFTGDPDSTDKIYRFESVTPTPAVPEPASWAMMIAGLGVVGGTMRAARRRTTLAFAA